MYHIMYHAFYFNSQPHKEADEKEIHENNKTEYFNSQPHKEADLCRSYSL